MLKYEDDDDKHGVYSVDELRSYYLSPGLLILKGNDLIKMKSMCI